MIYCVSLDNGQLGYLSKYGKPRPIGRAEVGFDLSVDMNKWRVGALACWQIRSESTTPVRQYAITPADASLVIIQRRIFRQGLISSSLKWLYRFFVIWVAFLPLPSRSILLRLFPRLRQMLPFPKVRGPVQRGLRRAEGCPV